jgi:hypothetical protein
MTGVVGGISINLSIPTEAVMTGIDILLIKDSITLVYLRMVFSLQNSNMIPLNHAFVLYRAFLRA